MIGLGYNFLLVKLASRLVTAQNGLLNGTAFLGNLLVGKATGYALGFIPEPYPIGARQHDSSDFSTHRAVTEMTHLTATPARVPYHPLPNVIWIQLKSTVAGQDNQTSLNQLYSGMWSRENVYDSDFGEASCVLLRLRGSE